jgi:hypothetical protein
MWFRTRSRGKAVNVPNVPGAKGIRPAPNQEAKHRADFMGKSALLKASLKVKVSDRDSDIKQVLGSKSQVPKVSKVPKISKVFKHAGSLN